MIRKFGCLVFALLAAMPLSAQEGRWDYRKMENFVRRICHGPNGNWILRMGHPKLTLRSLQRNWSDGAVFTESVLSPEAANFLMDLTQSKMTGNESCYDVSGYFLSYELMGFEALASLREAFDDSGITENCEHVPADDDLRALYLKCSQLEPAEKFLSETGGKFMFSADMIMSVRKRIANKLLISKRPENCEQVEELDEELYRGFTAAQRKFRKKLKASGYMKSIFTADWS